MFSHRLGETLPGDIAAENVVAHVMAFFPLAQRIAGGGRGIRRGEAAAVCLLAIAAPGCCDGTAMDTTPTSNLRTRHVGRIVASQPIEHTFQLDNASDQPFTIPSTDTSCHCGHTLLEGASPTLAPGETRPLQVAVKTQELRGPQRKSVLVQTDSANREWRSIEFVIEADVGRPVQCVPEPWGFANLGPGERVERFTTLEINDPE